MKTISTILLIFFSVNILTAQAPEIEWQKSFGGTQADGARALDNAPDGGYIIAGYTHSNDGDVTGQHGPDYLQDFWVIKLDSQGNIQWQKALGGTNADAAYAVHATADGGYIVAGYTRSADGDVTLNQGSSDYWVVKLNASSNMEWQKNYGGSAIDRAYCIRQTIDGGYIVAGGTNSMDGDVIGNNDGLNHGWILKLDTTGNIQWQKLLNSGTLTSIKQTPDNGYIATGFGCRAVKLDSSGNTLWQINEQGRDMKDVEITSDGGYIFVSSSTIQGEGGVSDYWILKTDSFGNTQWQKTYGGSNFDLPYSVKQLNDGNFIVAGESNSTDGDITQNHGSDDYWLVKLNPQGEIIWDKSLGGSSDDLAYSVQLTTDGGYIVAGESYGDVPGHHGSADFWVVKLHPDNMSLDDITKNTVSVYPNPVKDLLRISSDEKIESIALYNPLGQRTLTHYGNQQTAVQLDLTGLEKGIYVIQVVANEKTNTLKLIKK